MCAKRGICSAPAPVSASPRPLSLRQRPAINLRQPPISFNQPDFSSASHPSVAASKLSASPLLVRCSPSGQALYILWLFEFCAAQRRSGARAYYVPIK